MTLSGTSLDELRLIDKLAYDHFEATALGFWNSLTKDGFVKFQASSKKPFYKNTLKCKGFYNALVELMGSDRWQPLDNRIVEK